jgi:hypothetical protein
MKTEKTMRYVINILEAELYLVKSALKNWNEEQKKLYPQSYYQRQQRLYEIESAIEILKQVK